MKTREILEFTITYRNKEHWAVLGGSGGYGSLALWEDACVHVSEASFFPRHPELSQKHKHCLLRIGGLFRQVMPLLSRLVASNI